MQHKQIYHLFDEIHTPYFQEKHSTLIHNNVLIQLSSIKKQVYTSITNDQNVSTKMSPVTHNKLKTPKLLKHDIYYAGAVTKVNKLPITSIDLCYIITKKTLHQ
jgi:hypothetical protein